MSKSNSNLFDCSSSFLTEWDLLQRERGSRKIRWIEACCEGSLGAEWWTANSVGFRMAFHSARGFSPLDSNACPRG